MNPNARTFTEAAFTIRAQAEEIERLQEIVGRSIINLPPEMRSVDPNDGIKHLRAKLREAAKYLRGASACIRDAMKDTNWCDGEDYVNNIDAFLATMEKKDV